MTLTTGAAGVLPLGLLVHPDTNLLAGLAGGLIVAASSSAWLLLSGQVTGCSGILFRAVGAGAAAPGAGASASLAPALPALKLEHSYVLGLLASGLLLARYSPASFGADFAAPHVQPLAAIAAGVLVGAGTRLSNGCTSGHGVCGLPRRSVRSLAAVVTFIAAGAATAFFSRREGSALRALIESAAPLQASLLPAAAALAVVVAAFPRTWPLASLFGSGAATTAAAAPTPSASLHAAAFCCALVFGLGLGVSGMTSTEKVGSFLDFAGSRGFDASLALVMGGAVAANLLSFWLMSRMTSPPLLAPAGTKPLSDLIDMGPSAGRNGLIDLDLLLGAALFGVGWGLLGLCPGPAIVSLAAGGPLALYLVPGMIAGAALHDVVRRT